MPTHPEKEQASQKVAHWNELDGLRAIAFLMVFLFHVGPPPLPSGPLVDLYSWVVRWGWSGVDLFFVLSAFLITFLLLKEKGKHGDISFKLFFLRRALRIWPLYYVSLVLAFFLLPMVGIGPGYATQEWSQTLKLYGLPFALFLGNFTMLDSQAVPTPPIALNPMWSVCMEEQFYIVWCLLLILLAEVRWLPWFLLAVGLGSFSLRLMVFKSSDDFWPYYHNTLTHLDPIVAGALLGILQARGRLPRLGHPAPALALWLLLALGFPPLAEHHPSAPFTFPLIAAASAATLLAALNHQRTRELLSHPFAVRYGRLTYGLYIFHMLGIGLASMAIWAVNPWASPFAVWLTQLCLGLAITAAMAHLSWALLEGPCNRLRRRLSRV